MKLASACTLHLWILLSALFLKPCNKSYIEKDVTLKPKEVIEMKLFEFSMKLRITLPFANNPGVMVIYF